ncbi:MAG: hypothetical protein ACRDHP_00060 [Ktedonobacterales bacterium]
MVIAGIVFIALGIGLTVISYQLAPPGGTYIVFVGLIASGVWMIFRGLTSTSTANGKLHGYTRPAQSPVSGYIAPPQQMPPGFCWQCGRRVKGGKAVCFGCGAAQTQAATSHRPGDSASQYGWDLAGTVSSSPSGAAPWSSPPPSTSAAPSGQWNPSTYQSGASTRWDGPPNPPAPPGSVYPPYPR